MVRTKSWVEFEEWILEFLPVILARAEILETVDYKWGALFWWVAWFLTCLMQEIKYTTPILRIRDPWGHLALDQSCHKSPTFEIWREDLKVLPIQFQTLTAKQHWKKTWLIESFAYLQTEHMEAKWHPHCCKRSLVWSLPWTILQTTRDLKS